MKTKKKLYNTAGQIFELKFADDDQIEVEISSQLEFPNQKLKTNNSLL